MDGPTQLRVVSLLPGVTETIYILGVQDGLVGRSHNSKWPSAVLSIPCASRSARDAEQSPRDLDDKMVVLKGLTFYHVDLELLKELKPEVIFTEDQWEACGSSFEDPERATKELIYGDSRKCRIISFKPHTVEDIFNDIQAVANTFLLQEKGENLVQELKNRWKKVKEVTPQWVDGVPPINVACFQSFKPLVGTGYWIPEVVRCAGGVNVLSKGRHPGPVLAWEDVLTTDPDVIVITLYGFTLEDAAKEMPQLESKKGWSQLRSVIAKRVFLVDGNRFLNNPGPNIVESAELLAELLHGIEFGYEGMGFIRWEGTASSWSFDREPSKSALTGPLLVCKSIVKDPKVATVSSSIATVHSEHGNREHLYGFQMSPSSCLFSETNSIISTETCCTEPMERDEQWDMPLDASEAKQGKLLDAASQNDSSFSNIEQQYLPSCQKEFSGTGIHHQSGFSTLSDVNHSKNSVDFVGTAFRGDAMKSAALNKYLGYLDEDDDMEVLAKRWKQTLDLDGREGPSVILPKISSKKFSTISTHADLYSNVEVTTAKRSSNASSSESKDGTSTSRFSLESERELLMKMWTSTKAAAESKSSDAHVSSFQRNTHMSKMGNSTPFMGRELFKGSDKLTGFLPVTSLGTSFGHQFEGLNQHSASSCTVANSESTFPGLILLPEKGWVLRSVICMALTDALPADCLLLSGGLNSGILAEAAPMVHKGGYKSGITVLSGPTATDTVYAGAVAKRCGIDHIVVGGIRSNALTLLEQELDFVIKVMKTFDPPEVRRCVALAAALREAKKQGFQSVVLGDGADELFAGHSFMHGMTEYELAKYRQSIGSTFQFGAVPLGAALGIQVKLPYMHPKVIEYALGLNSSDLLGANNGSLVRDKLVLREAFHDVLPAWRKKDPIEVGSGMAFLSEYFSKRVSVSYLEAETKRISVEDKVQIRDAEHLAYYQAFKRVFKNDSALLHIEWWGQNPCCACGHELKSLTQMFCLTCGQYPAQSRSFQEQKWQMHGIVEYQPEVGPDEKSVSDNVVHAKSRWLPTEHDGKSLSDEVVHWPDHVMKHLPKQPSLSECVSATDLFVQSQPKSSFPIQLKRQKEHASLEVTACTHSNIELEALTPCFERLTMCNDISHSGESVMYHQEYENKFESTSDQFLAKENRIICDLPKGNRQASTMSVADEKVMGITKKRKAEHISKMRFWWGLGVGSAAVLLVSHLSKR